jgi:DNA-binding IclR family transcriptional regulator
MSSPTTGTVARAMHLLRALAEHESGATVAQLAGELALPRPTVHRLLNLLVDQDVASMRSDGRYEAGPELTRIAALVTKRRSLADLALPMMRTAVEACGETCWLGIYLPSQLAMTFVADVPSSHSLGYRMPADAVIPVLWGSSGQAILAHRPSDELDEILRLAAPSPATGTPVPSRAVLDEKLAPVRERGYAYTEGEKIPDARGIAAPIIGANGLAVASMVLTIPRIRFDAAGLPELGALIAEQGRRASELLGYEPALRSA